MNRIFKIVLTLIAVNSFGNQNEFEMFYRKYFPEQKGVFDSRKIIIEKLNVDTTFGFEHYNSPKFRPYYQNFYVKNGGITFASLPKRGGEKQYPLSRIHINNKLIILAILTISPFEESYSHQIFLYTFSNNGKLIDELKVDGYLRYESLIDYSSRIQSGIISVNYFYRFNKENITTSIKRYQTISYSLDSTFGKFSTVSPPPLFQSFDNKEMIFSFNDLLNDYLSCTKSLEEVYGNINDDAKKDFGSILVSNIDKMNCLPKGYWLITALADSKGIFLYERSNYVKLDPVLYKLSDIKILDGGLSFRIKKKDAKFIELKFKYTNDSRDKSWVLNTVFIYEGPGKEPKVEYVPSHSSITIKDVAPIVQKIFL